MTLTPEDETDALALLIRDGFLPAFLAPERTLIKKHAETGEDRTKN